MEERRQIYYCNRLQFIELVVLSSIADVKQNILSS